MFRGAGESKARVETATIPFSLGRTIRTGPYRDPSHPGSEADGRRSPQRQTTPSWPTPYHLAFFDEKQRLLFATTVALAAQQQGGPRQGAACSAARSLRASVRSIGVPVGDANAVRQSLSVIPIRWGETFAVNIPDSKAGEILNYGSKSPRKAQTRAWQARLDRTDEGTAKLSLKKSSASTGLGEFFLDLPVALLGESGEILACGHLATSLKVVSEPVEQDFEIDLGKIRGGVEPKSMAIGIAPGEILSAPMEFVLGHDRPPERHLQKSRRSWRRLDESCWPEAGFEELNRSSRLGRILPQEFLEDQYNGSRANDGPYSRHGQLGGRSRSHSSRSSKRPKWPKPPGRSRTTLAYSEAEERPRSWNR